MNAELPAGLDHLDEDTEYDDFLLSEGLELLAAYRAIPDNSVRAAVRQLIESLVNLPVPLN